MITTTGTPLSEVFRKLRDTTRVVERVASESAPLILADCARAYASAQSPDGTPWRPRVDGSRALPNAIEGLSVSVDASGITLRVMLPYTYHQTWRPMLPTAMPPAWGAIFSLAIGRAL